MKLTNPAWEGCSGLSAVVRWRRWGDGARGDGGRKDLGQLLETKFSDQVLQARALEGEGLPRASHTVSGLSW